MIKFKLNKWNAGLSLVFVLFILLLIYALIQPNIDNANKVNIVLGAEPSSLDPAISLTIDARAYISNMFEGLTNISQDGSSQPGVAETYSSNDEKNVYTFRLRDNAHWSDGSIVTADDFKYAWLRVLDPSTASGWASYLYYIKGAKEYNSGNASAGDVAIKVLDDKTLEVTLAAPNSFFGLMTALQPYFPVKKETIEKNGLEWSTKADSYVSNGPYKLENWSHNEQITLLRNTNYWDDNNVHLEQINFKLLSDPNLVISAYENNDLTYVAKVITAEQMSQVDKVQHSDFVYTKFLSPNLNSAALKDDRVRKAITLALDRNKVAKVIDGSQPLLSFIPTGFINSDKGLDFRKDGHKNEYLVASADYKEAVALLSEAGYNKEKPLSLVYLTNTSGVNVALAEMVQSQLKEVGILIDIQAYEGKVFNSYRKEKKYDLVAASWAAEYPDITSYLYEFTSSDSNNYPSYKNNNYDDLYSRLLVEPEGANKYTLAHQAEDLIMNNHVVFPLYYTADAYITDTNFKGYYQDITGNLVLKNAYFKE